MDHSIAPRQPTVWVIKEQVKHAIAGPEAMDYTPAMKYGQLEFITSFDLPLHPKSTVLVEWQKAVSKFCEQYDDTRDFIICTGQPIAIFMVGYMLATWIKRPRFLVWRRERNEYVLMEHGITHEAAADALSHALGVPVEIK